MNLRRRLSPSHRRLLVLSLAAASLAALAGARGERDSGAPGVMPSPAVASAATMAASPNATASTAAHGAQAATPDGRLEEAGQAFRVQPLPEVADAFQARDWRPPAPVVKPAPPPKPTAPPLPFVYLGSLQENGETTVYLKRGEDIVVVAPEEEFDPHYRLEEALPDRLVFRYLPLQQQQVMMLGSPR